MQVDLTKNGLKHRVTMDTYFPVDKHNRPCFSRANGSELWVLILEKAFAKLHGSYERIIGGLSHETFRDVLGAPGYSHTSDEEDAFSKIL